MTAFLQKQQNSQKRNPQHFLLLLLLLLIVTIINFADAMMPIGDAALQTVTAMTTLEEIPNSRVVEQRRQDHENRQFLTALRLRALQNLQRSLESLTTLTANSLMLNAALQSSESIEQEDPLMMQQEHDGADELFEMATSTMMPTTMPQGDGQQQQNLRHQHRLSSVLDHRRRRLSSSSISASSSQHSSAGVDDLQQQVMRIRPQRHGIRRLRADLKKMPPNSQEEEQQQQQEGKEGGGGGNDANANGGPTGGNNSGERPRNLNSRRMRSTSTTKHHGHHHHGGHKRRRKGCPSVHGKDQLLCPTRNTHRYDVCITREQLCDRIHDCPGGEDEDSRHCFFFRPLESSLKTISHAVLLLVDTVMREQEEHQQQRQQMDRNEL